MTSRNWEEKETAPGEDYFFIHEQDKVAVRAHLVEAIIGAPEAIRFLKINTFVIYSCKCLHFTSQKSIRRLRQ